MGITVFGLPAGGFTDDSSMMLCLAESLTLSKGFDPVDRMELVVKGRLHAMTDANVLTLVERPHVPYNLLKGREKATKPSPSWVTTD